MMKRLHCVTSVVPEIFLILAALILVLQAAPVYSFDEASMVARMRDQLENREAELNKREERLKTLEAELNEKIRQYEEITRKAEAYLEEIKAIQDEDLKHLIKTYEAMPPEAAAGRISKLETGLAVKVLRGMKTRSLGKLMANLSPSRAARLSKLMVAR